MANRQHMQRIGGSNRSTVGSASGGSFLDSISPLAAGLAGLAGLAVGAALIYMMDPTSGRRRRAYARDKFYSLSRQARECAGDLAQDASNRTRGLAAETRAWLTEGEIADRTLVERVRSHIGHAISNAHAIDITANNGVITVRGCVPSAETYALFAAIRGVRGVRDVENELDTSAEQHAMR
jgi:osmotically-inducible protein OsmY